MTSNIGSQEILESQQGGQSYEALKLVVTAQLQRHFRPEFLNRVDETVVFHALTVQNLVKIVDIQLARLRDRLAERRIMLNLTPAALEDLGRRGYDPVYGARPLKRLIQQDIETPIARLLVKGELRDGDVATVEIQDGRIAVIPTVEATP
jgi:ATP-dependent Clp protease ATP-binding subunit ClpB